MNGLLLTSLALPLLGFLLIFLTDKKLLLTSLALPLLGFLLIFLTDKNEQKIATISFWCSHAMGISIIALLIMWAIAGFPNHEYEWFTLYETDGYRFPILFYLDRIGIVCRLGNCRHRLIFINRLL
ncbi:MAG: hypothetical protein RLZZ419_2070 [Pseudomonadota bacterium]